MAGHVHASRKSAHLLLDALHERQQQPHDKSTKDKELKGEEQDVQVQDLCRNVAVAGAGRVSIDSVAV
jgi:hypothetical protein